ncbi:MAG: Mu transposase C-terminal domain-containing protein [Myxococcales bacterium]|jgi:putative transposase
MDDKTKEEIALFRIAVLGPLVGAELEHGDLLELCRQAAERRWEWPDGTLGRVEARTVENWYYAYRRGGFEALKPKDRKDLGQSEIRTEVADLLLRAKRERPRRSLRRLIRMMELAGKALPGELSRSSVHRLLARHGVSRRPLRGPTAERRSFIYEFAGELLVGDALHLRRRVLGPDGRPRKVYMLSQIDCATRYLPESIFAFSEDAATQERGLKSALLAHGLWQRYYVDLGSAYVAGSLKLICAELGIELLHAGPRDAAAKGVIEKWHRTWREEVEDELPDRPITFAELEQKHRAWLTCEYHARKHETTDRAPREHWLEQCAKLRAAPSQERIDELFLHRARRTVSKTGCVRWQGGRLEVSPELCGRQIELRFDPHTTEKLPRVFVDGRFVCDTVALDLVRNSRRKRRRDLGEPAAPIEPTGLDPLADLVREHQRLTRPLDHLARKEPADDEDSTKD